ncbi:MAG TPA: GMC family oxidoreductase, partial [Patescibacteria group bacterium]|nr:GMC family oxidoreductase [Patescibacteria group bacterium]
PAELTNAGAIPTTHDWGYDSGGQYPSRVIPFERARVIGGCSSHNGCAAIWGSRLDYDGWAAAGNPGWSTDELLPIFRAASDRIRIRIPEPVEITPYQHAALEAAALAGIPRVADLNNLDQNLGMGPSPANIANGIRWNTAFAYLDPVRERSNLTIAGDATCDRLEIEAGRVKAVVIASAHGPVRIECGRVIVAAGTYGSAAILLRSGIGDPVELREASINPTLDLAGVGRNLHDHPRVSLHYAGTRELEQIMTAFERDHWMPEEQTIAKAQSSRCPEAFDLHVYPVGGRYEASRTGWGWSLEVACMTPRSRGALRLTSADVAAPPVIDHRYLSDPGDEDLRILADGIAIARDIAAKPVLSRLAGKEFSPGGAVSSRTQIEEFAKAKCLHYYHPVGTCRMGPASDRSAVVDSRGKVHGLDNAYVADASIMPVIPRANTNVPALVVGERIARSLLQHD